MTPPALATPAPAGITQHENATRTDDERADDEQWAKAQALDTIRVYEHYLHANTTFKKRHLKEAEQRFEQLVKQEKDKDDSIWKQACSENTVKAYQEYLAEDFYSKRHADEARKKIEGLERKPDVHESEPIMAKLAPPPSSDNAAVAIGRFRRGLAPSPSGNAPRPPSTSKWRKFVLIGVAVVLGYVIWANLGGDSKSPANSGQQPEIAELLRLASTDISVDHLGNPPGNNALEKYRRILSIEPDNTGALQGIKAVANRYRELSSLAATKGDSAKAREYQDKAEALDPSPALVDAVPAPPTVAPSSPPTLAPSPPSSGMQRQEEERRCRALVNDGWNILSQKPDTNYDLAILRAREAQQVLSDCPGAADLLAQASVQKDKFVQEQQRKERDCQNMVIQGNQAIQMRRYDQAMRYAVNAKSTYPQCPGADQLEQNALTAINSANEQVESNKRSKCDNFVATGNEDYRRRNYDSAIRKANQALRIYPQCPGADELRIKAENSANEQAESDKRSKCDNYVTSGNEDYRRRNYESAIRRANQALQIYPQCPGADELRIKADEAQLANIATTAKTEQEARIRCEALVEAGRVALQSMSYDQAINSARRAIQTYPQCQGATALEKEARDAKRSAREKTVIY